MNELQKLKTTSTAEMWIGEIDQFLAKLDEEEENNKENDQERHRSAVNGVIIKPESITENDLAKNPEKCGRRQNYTRGREGKDKKNAKQRLRRVEQGDHVRMLEKALAAKNRDRRNEQSRLSYVKHRQQRREKMKQYVEKNRVTYNERRRQLYKEKKTKKEDKE